MNMLPAYSYTGKAFYFAYFFKQIKEKYKN